MTLPPADRPRVRRSSTRRTFIWSIIGLAFVGFFAWRRIPTNAHQNGADSTVTRSAAGEVKIPSPTSPRSARVSNLPQFVVQYDATVTFAPGSASLTGSSARLLDKLVGKGTALPGYLIEVTGFADAAESAPF